MLKRPSFLLLCSCLGAAVGGCDQTAAPEAAKKNAPPPLVTVTRPVADEVVDYEDFTGQTGAMYSVDVRARVTGYLDKVYFTDGAEVKEGADLFLIDPRPYMADYQRTEATVVQSEAHFKRLEADFRRAESLFNRHNISREEYDKIAGDRAEADASVGIAKSTRDLSKLSLEYTKIKAPISGRLSRRQVDPGNLVKADDTILTNIVSLDPLFVYFDIDEQTVLHLRRLIREGKLKSREEAEIPILCALSDEQGFPRQGTINFSENKVDPNTGTLRARALISNPIAPGTKTQRVLSPGMYMKVRLPVGIPARAILVPEQAIGTDQGEKFVYVVNTKDAGSKTGTGTVARKPVKVGALNDGFRVILSGLTPEELVIYRGLQRVRQKAEVHFELEEARKPPGAAAAVAQADPTPLPGPAGKEPAAPAPASASVSAKPERKPASAVSPPTGASPRG